MIAEFKETNKELHRRVEIMTPPAPLLRLMIAETEHEEVED